MNEQPLRGQVALITGSSRGIGRAIALRLAASGAKIVVNYNSSLEGAKEVVQAVVERQSEAMAVAADVTKGDQIDAMVKAVGERWGRIDILVNNAGIIRDKLLLRMAAPDWDSVMDTNLRGTYLMTRAALPLMLKQHSGGRILNITSVIGITGNAGQSNYAASKAGIIGFTKAMSRELATRQITVNAIAPGFVETEIVAHFDEAKLKMVVDRIPLGRLGTANDIAGMAHFLCLPDAAYVTGQVIRVDGGLII